MEHVVVSDVSPSSAAAAPEPDVAAPIVAELLIRGGYLQESARLDCEELVRLSQGRVVQVADPRLRGLPRDGPESRWVAHWQLVRLPETAEAAKEDGTGSESPPESRPRPLAASSSSSPPRKEEARSALLGQLRTKGRPRQ